MRCTAPAFKNHRKYPPRHIHSYKWSLPPSKRSRKRVIISDTYLRVKLLLRLESGSSSSLISIVRSDYVPRSEDPRKSSKCIVQINFIKYKFTHRLERALRLCSCKQKQSEARGPPRRWSLSRFGSWQYPCVLAGSRMLIID